MLKKLKGLALPDIEIINVNKDKISEINRLYLGRSGPTNIITFPFSDGKGRLTNVTIYICEEKISDDMNSYSVSESEMVETLSSHIVKTIKKSLCLR